MRKVLAIVSVSLMAAAGSAGAAPAAAEPIFKSPQLLARGGRIDNIEADNALQRNERRQQRQRSVPARPPATKPVAPAARPPSPPTARPPAVRQAPRPSARPGRVAPPPARPQASRPIQRTQPRIDNLEQDNSLGISERRRQEARAREQERGRQQPQRGQSSRRDSGRIGDGQTSRRTDRRTDPSHLRARPQRGTTVRVLPPQHNHHVHRGHDYYFSRGAWYRPSGPSFIVTAPPFGLIVPVLPSIYARYSYGNNIYFVADDVYYQRVDRGYEIVPAPVLESSSVADLDAYEDMPVLKIFRREQQSDAELINDKVQCHYQAVDRTGYDPTISGGGVPSAVYLERKHDYRRAISACLDRRGYTVR